MSDDIIRRLRDFLIGMGFLMFLLAAVDPLEGLL